MKTRISKFLHIYEKDLSPRILVNSMEILINIRNSIVKRYLNRDILPSRNFREIEYY